jgi:L-ascorbate metabolism protein UlaG (beta-lactamase superfamily)
LNASLVLLLSLTSGIISGQTIVDKGVRMEWHGRPDTVTFIGHSTTVIDLGGTRILTDPNYSSRIGFSTSLKCLPQIQIIAVSHGHYDHLDAPTMEMFPKNITVVVPPRLDGMVRKMGFTDVRVMRPGEVMEVAGVKIFCVPARHFTGRNPFNPASGYQGYIFQKGKSVYFAGDTALFQGFSDIGKLAHINLALLPIGAYRPSPFRMNHMSPADALHALTLLGADAMVPIHFGTFKLSLESMTEPPVFLMEEAARRGLDSKVHVLRPGDFFEIK